MSPPTRSPKPGKSAGIKAATGRAARNALASGSVPRKALAAVGRGTKKTWAATAPHRKHAATVTGRHARHLGGAARDGLRSLLAGAWAGLKKRDRHAALARIREVWGRRRKARTNKTTSVVPVVAATVRRPASTFAPASTPGATAVSGYHFVAPAAEAARAAASYQPTGMMQVGQDFAGLQEALELYAQAMKTTVENAHANQPLDPQIIEMMRQIHHLQLKAAELAGELQPAFRKLHHVDIQRIENGRTGERMWDVTANN